MATFGVNPSDVGDWSTYWTSDVKFVDLFTLSEVGLVESVSLRLGVSTGGNIPTKGVIYQGDPLASAELIAVSPETVLSNESYAWCTFTFTTPVLLQAGDYYLGAHTDCGTGPGYLYFRYNYGGTMHYNADTYSDGPTDPFGTATNYSEELLVYATYTPAWGHKVNGVLAPAEVNSVELGYYSKVNSVA